MSLSEQGRRQRPGYQMGQCDGKKGTGRAFYGMGGGELSGGKENLR